MTLFVQKRRFKLGKDEGTDEMHPNLPFNQQGHSGGFGLFKVGFWALGGFR
jgi:hypothetical protein